MDDELFVLCDTDSDGNVTGSSRVGREVIPDRSYHHCIKQAFPKGVDIVLSDYRIERDENGYAVLVLKEETIDDE